MTERMRKIIPVLRHRETKSRLALARLTRALTSGRARVRQIDQLMSGVAARLSVCLESRQDAGTIAALIEMEDQMKALRAARERLAGLKCQAQQALEELAARRRLQAREWQRNETRLGHVDTLARRAKISQAIKAGELDDEAQTEAHALGRSGTGRQP